MQQFFTYNGNLYPTGTPVFQPSSRAFRYGDSLFETIRLHNGRLLLFDFHFDRLTKGMQLLGIETGDCINQQFLQSAILELANKNNLIRNGRVRLTVFRKDTILNEPVSSAAQWLIECTALPKEYFSLNQQGFSIDIASDNRKPSGPLSNTKSGNYLLYVLAAQLANTLGVSECLVLNHAGRIADSTRFNLFLIKNQIVYTPSLEEGPVEGVMRRHVLKYFQEQGKPVRETAINISDVEAADELFLTNALYGICWVGTFQSFNYTNTITRRLYTDLFQQYLT
jgi:branched-chain amino acid aminotransferase